MARSATHQPAPAGMDMHQLAAALEAALVAGTDTADIRHQIAAATARADAEHAAAHAAAHAAHAVHTDAAYAMAAASRAALADRLAALKVLDFSAGK